MIKKVIYLFSAVRIPHLKNSAQHLGQKYGGPKEQQQNMELEYEIGIFQKTS